MSLEPRYKSCRYHSRPGQHGRKDSHSHDSLQPAHRRPLPRQSAPPVVFCASSFTPPSFVAVPMTALCNAPKGRAAMVAPEKIMSSRRHSNITTGSYHRGGVVHLPCFPAEGMGCMGIDLDKVGHLRHSEALIATLGLPAIELGVGDAHLPGFFTGPANRGQLQPNLCADQTDRFDAQRKMGMCCGRGLQAYLMGAHVQLQAGGAGCVRQANPGIPLGQRAVRPFAAEYVDLTQKVE